MAIRIRCSCGNRFEVEAGLPGSTIPCPLCGEDLPVPRAESAQHDGRTRVHGSGEDFSLDAPGTTGTTRLVVPANGTEEAARGADGLTPPSRDASAPSESVPTGGTPLKSSPSLVAVVVASGVVLALGLGWLWLGRDGTPPLQEESVDLGGKGGLGGKKERQQLSGLPPLTPMPPYQGPRPWVTSVAFSPDGKLAALGGGSDPGRGTNVPEYTLGIFEVDTGREVRYFPGKTQGIRHLEFSPDGRYVLTSQQAGGPILWDIEKGQIVRTFDFSKNSAVTVGFLPDGKRVVACGNNLPGTVRLWDVETGRELWSFTPPKGFYLDWQHFPAGFNPDRTVTLSGSEGFASCVLDAATGKERIPLQVFHKSLYPHYLTSLAVTPDGKDIVLTVGSRQGDTVHARETLTGREIARFPGRHKRNVTATAVSPDGNLAASADGEHPYFVLWDLRGGQQVRKVEGHRNAILALAFSADGKTLLSGSADHTMRLWDVATGAPIRVFGKTGK